MKKSKYIWKYPENPVFSEEFTELLNEKNISPLVGKLLWQRGIQTSEQLALFLTPSIEALHDPFLIYEMDKAIERIQQAVEQGERILVYGDYDADGITSTTVMKEAVELIGGEVDYFLPNRFIHGYGPNLSVFKEKIESGIQLIITVDNGVAGHEAVNYAKEQGIDVIITDHHELPEILPDALAVIHPKHPKGDYPFGDLAGVGVAFKVASALLGETPTEFFDLVAIGTIADLVSLTGENRMLVQMGLKMIQSGDRIGLDALIHSAGLKKEEISEENIGFAIGPRLNALGRLGEAAPGVELMTTFDEDEALSIAKFIEEKNTERKKIVETITEEAFTLLDLKSSIHVLAQKGWHEGVLGIVAGRIMQETGKPTIVLTIDENGSTAKGSGRSVSTLNMYDALNEKRELFTHFGGHHMAAGMTLPVENIDVLKEQLIHYIEKNAIDLSQGQELQIDEVLTIEETTLSFINQLKLLAPFGTDNPMPNFSYKKVAAIQVRQIGAQQDHLKLQITDGSASLDVIAFQMGKDAKEFAENRCNIAGKLSINEWNGNKKPQLMAEDYSIEDIQLFDLRGKANQQQDIPEKNTLFVYFQKESVKLLKTDIGNMLYYESSEQLLSETNGMTIEQLVIVDCPDELDDIKQLIEGVNVNRIYLLGLSTDEAYLNGTGSREQFSKLYSLIRKQGTLDVRYKLDTVSNYLQIQEKLLIFMIQVFFDLGFVTIEDGILRNVDTPENHPLTESEVYQKRLKKIKVEEFLLYSDRKVLLSWLLNEEEE
ncbi:single-stranded-DNA-specific exonuclease RecJ [Enterococcus sp. CWB-B31]|uniref:single-stranded-DNA-specific exonuclease RecJ n=1 Tax=Enterococcus sp. CWB-B31 TaxID=2885159 RepID=UPI001E28E6B4|nr:single-stranded-DNA-specific exonuclease RecJ [Enterococcus sp. CWB-B31]MCB5955946.1 single-stranded-DNA-specific exonuclease RecJ [Enterococcus sp. CWB-B31]